MPEKENRLWNVDATSIGIPSKWRIREVRVSRDFGLWLRFNDDTQGEIDLTEFLRSPRTGVFSSLLDKETLFPGPIGTGSAGLAGRIGHRSGRPVSRNPGEDVNEMMLENLVGQQFEEWATYDDEKGDHPSVERAVSDYEKNVTPILAQIAKGFIESSVPEEDDRTAMRIHLSTIIMSGRNWYTDEKKRRESRNSGIFSRRRSIIGTRSLFRSLERREGRRWTIPYSVSFQGHPPEDPSRMPFPKGPMDSVKDMLATCNRILGTKDPKRYPCRKIVADTLALWTKYTNKSPRNWAIQPPPIPATRKPHHTHFAVSS